MSVTSAANPDLVDRLRGHMSAAADPGRAATMRAYMRDREMDAWTDPEAVRAFVRANEAAVSPLSKREALKYIA